MSMCGRGHPCGVVAAQVHNPRRTRRPSPTPAQPSDSNTAQRTAQQQGYPHFWPSIISGAIQAKVPTDPAGSSDRYVPRWMCAAPTSAGQRQRRVDGELKQAQTEREAACRRLWQVSFWMCAASATEQMEQQPGWALGVQATCLHRRAWQSATAWPARVHRQRLLWDLTRKLGSAAAGQQDVGALDVQVGHTLRARWEGMCVL